MASCAVSLWSWSTSIRQATRFLAVKQGRSHKSVSHYDWARKLSQIEKRQKFIQSQLWSNIFCLSIIPACHLPVYYHCRFIVSSCRGAYRSQRFHPSMVNQTHNLQLGSSGRGSCHDCRSHRHQHLRRMEGFLTAWPIRDSKQLNLIIELHENATHNRHKYYNKIVYHCKCTYFIP